MAVAVAPILPTPSLTHRAPRARARRLELHRRARRGEDFPEGGAADGQHLGACAKKTHSLQSRFFGDFGHFLVFNQLPVPLFFGGP